MHTMMSVQTQTPMWITMQTSTPREWWTWWQPIIIFITTFSLKHIPCGWDIRSGIAQPSQVVPPLPLIHAVSYGSLGSNPPWAGASSVVRIKPTNIYNALCWVLTHKWPDIGIWIGSQWQQPCTQTWATRSDLSCTTETCIWRWGLLSSPALLPVSGGCQRGDDGGRGCQ